MWLLFRHVGVCCPDDIVVSSLTGSRIVMDLPAGGHDYDDEENSSTLGEGIIFYYSIYNINKYLNLKAVVYHQRFDSERAQLNHPELVSGHG